ncbi:MAG TPA: OmpA family protein [Methylotenera sp.]
MKKNIINIAVAASLGMTALVASAEDMYRGAWYALPGISYMDTDGDLEANNGGGGFLKLGKELSEHWDIQAGLGYNRASEDTGIPGVGGRYKQTTLSADALYMFSRDKFRPFLLAGLGAARNNVDYSHATADVSDSNTSWLANVGLGAQYLFSDNFGLQADLRHQWSRADVINKDNIFAGNSRETIGNTILSLGGIFRFGAPAPVVAVAEPVAAPAPVAPEPAPAPAPVVAEEPCQPKFETITLQAEKLFGFDKFKLNGDSVPELNDVVAKLKAHPEFDIVVVTGHTDRLGSEQYNQKLSEKRAEVIKNHLVNDHGIDASRIRTVGKGELQPLVACDDVKGKKALIECLSPNRRVVISGERQHPVNECK